MQSSRAQAGLTQQTNIANLQAELDTQRANLDAQLQVALTNGNFEQASRLQNELNSIETQRFNIQTDLQVEQAQVQRDLDIAGLDLQTQQLLQNLLGVTAFENVVTAFQPTTGAAAGIAAAATGAAIGG